MLDKTTLELAREIVGESGIHAHLSLWAHNINTVAAALIERMTLVEVSGAAWVDCPSCKGFIWASGRPKFCHNCGVPIKWM